MAMKSLREQHKENTKNAILEAAFKEYGEVGFERATLDNIAQRAGISKAAIYLYFKSKDDLFITIINNEFDNTEKLLLELEDKNPTLEEMTLLAINNRTTLERGDKHPGFWMSLLGPNPSKALQMKVKKAVDKRLANFMKIITRYFKTKQKEGAIRSTISCECLSYHYLGIINAMDLYWMINKKNPDVDFSQSLMDIIFNGINANNQCGEKQ